MHSEIVPLQECHVEGAARLAAASFQRQRTLTPLMPDRYASWETMAGLLGGLRSDLQGAALLQDGVLAGYLCGMILPEFLGKRAFYSPEWGSAADPSDSRRIYEALYTALAPGWLTQGCDLHVLSLMCHDREALAAFQWLGFGMAAVDGLRSLEPVECRTAPVTICRAGLDDAPRLDPLLTELGRHLAGSPAFWAHEQEPAEHLLRDERFAFWLALAGDETVGCLAGMRGYDQACAVLQDEQTLQVEHVYVKPGWRGRSVTPAMLQRCLEYGRENRFLRCSVDFEAANVLARRFWLRWFDPVCYSLVRWIGLGAESQP